MSDDSYFIIDTSGAPEERRTALEVGVGLQRIDGIEPSDYGREVGEAYVAGLSAQDAVAALNTYYANRAAEDQRVAEISAIRIAELVRTPGTFFMTPGVLRVVHRTIFDGLFPDHPNWEGQYRTEVIGKPEAVLGGRTVAYAHPTVIDESVRSVFEAQERINPAGWSDMDAARAALRFASSIWHIHPFREGNTRTVAVLAIKYLQDLGVTMTNEPFKEHATYFRDALALACAPGRDGDKAPLLFFASALIDGSIELPDLRAVYPAARLGDV